jgi:adenine deaminase
LVIKNASIVRVFTGDIITGDVAIAGGRIAGIGRYEGRETINAEGKFLAPGFMDAHVHIESSMVSIPEYARAVVPGGTTAVVIDPHEIANVLGAAGIQTMLDSSRNLPLDVFVMVPSCVPATYLETSGAALSANDIAPFFDVPGVLGLAEMMNFPGVLFKVPDVMEKLRAASGRVIDGHAPGLTGKDLCAYVAAGIRSDHECTTAEEALEKIALGMTVFVREGTAAKNLETLVPVINAKNAGQFAFCTDDRHPADLLAEGHIAFLIKKAVRLGLDPALAVRMATLNPARYFGLKDRGAVAPGYRADLTIFDGFDDMNVECVLKNGKVVARKGSMAELGKGNGKASPPSSMRIKPIGRNGLEIAAGAIKRVRVIQVVPGQIVTKQVILDAPVRGGLLVSDVERDLLKMAVVERHAATGRIGLGFARGFGLKKGALASSVAHDSHNVIVVGTNDADMLAAVLAVAGTGGGLAVIDGEKTIALLPLPIAGLMSDQPIEKVRDQIEALKKAARALGCALNDPFMQLSFLALPVIPELKLTDRGLVDVGRFDFVPLDAD